MMNMEYNYKPKRRGNNMFDQVPTIKWDNVIVKCPCSDSKGFKRKDHFCNHLNTYKHFCWVKEYNDEQQKKRLAINKRKNFNFTIKFIIIYIILMYYWFEPIRNWLLFKSMEYSSNEPIFEILPYDKVYNFYLNKNISFGGITISW